MHNARWRSETGVALVAVILILALLMGLAVALTTSVTMDSGLRGGYNRATTAFYTAESGLNVAMDGFRNKFLNFQVPSGSDFNTQTFTLGQRTVTYRLQDPGGNPKSTQIPAGRLFGGLNSIEYTYIVDSQSVKDSVTEADVGAEFDVENIPLFQFVAFYSNDLEIMPGADMHLHGRVHTNGDLYLNSDASLYIEPTPGNPTVQVTARNSIHRGRKNTTACTGVVSVATNNPTPTPKTLDCVGGASSAIPVSTLSAWNGSMVANVKSIAVPTPGIITQSGTYWTKAQLRIGLNLNSGPPYSIVVLNADGSTDSAKTATLMQFANDATFNNATSAYKGTKPIFFSDVPQCSSCTADNNPTGCTNTAPSCYWGTPAPTPTNTPTITRTPGPGTPTVTRTPTPNASATATPTSDLRLTFGSTDRVYTTNTTTTLGGGSMWSDSQLRRGGFWNWREQKWMYLLNVNVADLLQWNMNNGYPFFDPNSTNGNGGVVLYLTVQGPSSASSGNNYGVRVFGSPNLPFPTPVGGDPTGITIVSDQAIYVAGDYNSTGTKQPAAFMGDSMNLLSNNALLATSGGNACTNDCQSINSLSGRGAATTTVKAAFLGGVDTTTAGNYNGGLENYPRFHEDWGGDTLNYRGSFVSLGSPTHVNGAWCGTGGSSTSTSVSGCNIYNPPNRNYDYDSDYNDVKNLPPLTPEFVYVQQIVFTENFK